MRSIFTRIRLAPEARQEPVQAKECIYGLCDGFGLIEVENRVWKLGAKLMACPCSKTLS